MFGMVWFITRWDKDIKMLAYKLSPFIPEHLQGSKVYRHNNLTTIDNDNPF